MTRFQRRAMAILIHAFQKELGDRGSGIHITERYVKVYSESKQLLATFKVHHLSWDDIKLEDEYTGFKFFSELMSNYLVLRSEDEHLAKIEIHKLYPTLTQGKDDSGSWFDAEVPEHKKVKIKDGELKHNFVYLLEW